MSASSNSVSFVPKKKTSPPEEKESGGEDSQEFFTCPSQASSLYETAVPDPEHSALGYEMEEVEDEFV